MDLSNKVNTQRERHTHTERHTERDRVLLPDNYSIKCEKADYFYPNRRKRELNHRSNIQRL